MDERCSICGHTLISHVSGPDEDRYAPNCPEVSHDSFCADCDEDEGQDEEHEFVAALPDWDGYRFEATDPPPDAPVTELTPAMIRDTIARFGDPHAPPRPLPWAYRTPTP